MACVAFLVLVVLWYRSATGHTSDVLSTASVADVPGVGRQLESFCEGDVRYRVQRTYRADRVWVTGQMTRPNFDAFCAANPALVVRKDTGYFVAKEVSEAMAEPPADSPEAVPDTGTWKCWEVLGDLPDERRFSMAYCLTSGRFWLKCGWPDQK